MSDGFRDLLNENEGYLEYIQLQQLRSGLQNQAANIERLAESQKKVLNANKAQASLNNDLFNLNQLIGQMEVLLTSQPDLVFRELVRIEQIAASQHGSKVEQSVLNHQNYPDLQWKEFCLQVASRYSDLKKRISGIYPAMVDAVATEIRNKKEEGRRRVDAALAYAAELQIRETPAGASTSEPEPGERGERLVILAVLGICVIGVIIVLWIFITRDRGAG